MIKGKLVTIRNVKQADIDELYTLSFDYTDAGEYMPLNLVSETGFKREFERTGFWEDFSGKLIVEDQTGQMVGEVGCFKTTHYIDGREIYYRVFSGYRNRGYASEALALLVKLLFESSPMNRIQAVTVDGNKVSEAMLKKFGFKHEGILRQARYFKGQLVDLNQFSLLRSEWNG